MFQGFLLGAVTVLAASALLNFMERCLSRLRNRKRRLPEVSKFRRLSYLSLAKHDEGIKVDRLFGIKR